MYKGVKLAKSILESNGYSVTKRINEDLRSDMLARRAQARANRDSKKAARIEKIKNSPDPLEAAFQELVPSQGSASTEAGELVRAMMRILYRDYNDGDIFYDGYGVETCGSAVNFIVSNVPSLEHDFEMIAMRGLSGSMYTQELEKISNKLMDYLFSNPALFTTKNEDDYLEYDDEEFLKEKGWMPEYEFEVEIPDNVQAHIDEGNIRMRDVEWEIESWDVVRNGVISSRPYSGIIISELDSDSYKELEHHMYQWLEEWGNELDNEFGIPGDDDSDEE